MDNALNESAATQLRWERDRLRSQQQELIGLRVQALDMALRLTPFDGENAVANAQLFFEFLANVPPLMKVDEPSETKVW